MGEMMGGMAASMALWTVLILAVAVTCGVAVARVLRYRHAGGQITAGEPRGLVEARESLRQRYARGEISREEYLQGKVELED
jgi:putative membrane protein